MTAFPEDLPLHRPTDTAGSPRGRDPSSPTAFTGDDFDRDVWCVLGLPVDVTDIPAAVDKIEAAVRTGRRLSFVTPNVNWLVRALRDDTARREILNADLSLADGAPLVAIARMLGVPVRTRVAGSDLFEALMLRPGFPGRRIRVFFFGGREGSAEAAHVRLAQSRGGMEPAGWLNPGFGDVASMSSNAIIDRINAADPDFVVVALGAAKGQAWIEANQDRLTAPVIAHLGAVVDFAAGAVKRAPRWIARSGFEWAWRIAQEPALWRRYAFDAASLARLLATQFAPQIGRGRAAAVEAASARLETRRDGVVVRLGGSLTWAGLAPVRAAFREAAALGTDITLEFSGACAADRAFLGLLLMLEKASSAGQVRLAGTPSWLRALLAANAMRYSEATAVSEPRRGERDRARTAAS